MTENLARCAKHMPTNMLFIGKDEDGKPFLLPTKDLTRHVFVSGSTGSGKSVLFRRIIENAAIEGIPSIVVDLQGDLSRLLLPREMSEIEEENREYLKRYLEKVEPIVITPGGKINPINLSPFSIKLVGQANHAQSDNQGKTRFEDTAYAKAILVSNLIPGLSPVSASFQSIVTFLYYVFSNAALQGTEILSPKKLHEILSHEEFIPTREQASLSKQAQRLLLTTLQHLQVGPNARLHGQGISFDMNSLIRSPREKTRIVILNLTDIIEESTKNQIIANLLHRIYVWGFEQPRSRPKLIIGLDELHGIAPPVKHTITKKHLLKIAKQGRKYGLCLLLATQKPVDIDANIVGECNTYFLGRHTGRRDWENLKQAIEGNTSLRESSGSFIHELNRLGTGQFFYIGISRPVKLVHVVPGVTDFIGAPLTTEEVSEITPKIEDNPEPQMHSDTRPSSPRIQKRKPRNKKRNTKHPEYGENMVSNPLSIVIPKPAKKMNLAEVMAKQFPQVEIKGVEELATYLFITSITPQISFSNEKNLPASLKQSLAERLGIEKQLRQKLLASPELSVIRKHIQQRLPRIRKTKLVAVADLSIPETVRIKAKQFEQETVQSSLQTRGKIAELSEEQRDKLIGSLPAIRSIESLLNDHLEKAEEAARKAKQWSAKKNQLMAEYQETTLYSRKKEVFKQMRKMEQLEEASTSKAKKHVETAKTLKARRSEIKTIAEDALKGIQESHTVRTTIIKFPVTRLTLSIKAHPKLEPMAFWLTATNELLMPCFKCLQQGLPLAESIQENVVDCDKCGTPICPAHQKAEQTMLKKNLIVCSPNCGSEKE